VKLKLVEPLGASRISLANRAPLQQALDGNSAGGMRRRQSSALQASTEGF
jgi:hypothetical protein